MAFVKASTIEVPDILFHTIKTGAPEIDSAFSELGGIVPSQAVLMTGKPGSGKTTLALVATSKMFLATNNPGAFISLEMSDFQLALSKKKFPGFDNMMVDTTFSIKKTIRELRELKPSSVVLDSIQKAAGLMVKNKESANFNQAQKEIVDIFYKFAKETFIPVFLIGHCSKGGAYLGPSHLEHEVDSHLHVDYDEEEGMRSFRFGKNRFGGTNEAQLFGITSSGVWLGSPYVTDTELDDLTDAPAPEHDKLASTFATIYNQFRDRNANKATIEAIDARTFTKATIDFLKEFDKPFMARHSLIGDSTKVKVAYDYKGVAQCDSRRGIIHVGKVMTSDRFQVGRIGYRKEQPFIQRNVQSREELFLWVLIHEWVHLYKGMQHHKVEFFRRVEVLYKSVLQSLA